MGNPFLNEKGWMHQAWEEGYAAWITEHNPYEEDSALVEAWEAGFKEHYGMNSIPKKEARNEC